MLKVVLGEWACEVRLADVERLAECFLDHHPEVFSSFAEACQAAAEYIAWEMWESQGGPAPQPAAPRAQRICLSFTGRCGCWACVLPLLRQAEISDVIWA